MKKLVKMAILPKYRPGYGSINVVWSRDGLCPTITYNAGRGNSPLILVEESDYNE